MTDSDADLQPMQQEPPNDSDDFVKVIVRYLFLLALITLVIFFIIDSYTTKFCETEFTALAATYLELDSYSFTILYFAISVLLTVVNFPMTILAITGGYIFEKKFELAIGLSLACVVNIVSFTVGAMICFCLSSYCFRDASYIESIDTLQGLDKALKKNGFTINVLLRLTPILPASVMNYTLPALGTNFGDFSLGAFLGTLPYSILMTTVGALVAADNTTQTQIWKGVPLWATISAAILGVLLMGGTVYLLMVYTLNEIDQIKNLEEGNNDDGATSAISISSSVYGKEVEEEFPLLESKTKGV